MQACKVYVSEKKGRPICFALRARLDEQREKKRVWLKADFMCESYLGLLTLVCKHNCLLSPPPPTNYFPWSL